MKITGITAEYNPLHNGHVYHISEARRLSGCDAVAVAMSGDFVQRGEPAVFDKWTRAKAALSCGADLVVEIPALFCLGNAAQYASAGVRLLEALGCSHIAFGSECGDAELLGRVADTLKEHSAEAADLTASFAKEGLSYPAARAEAYRAIRSGCRDIHADPERTAGRSGPESEDPEMEILSRPNDILALEYMMSMRHAVPVAVRRKGAGYHDGIDPDAGLQSAGALRKLMMGEGGCGDTSSTESKDILARCVPAAMMEIIRSTEPSFAGDWTAVIRYAALSKSPDEIEDCPSGGEGLGRLLARAALEQDSPDGLILAVKSKRYTYTRISRLCMQNLLGITRSLYPYAEPLYIRVLGFTEKGRSILAGASGPAGASSGGAAAGCIPVITNINKAAGELSGDARRMLSLDVHAADIYNLVTGRDTAAYSDHRLAPVMI